MPADHVPHYRRWSRTEFASLAVMLAASVAATWDAWSDTFWLATRDEEQSHVLLVPVIALWLAWVRRGRLRRCPRDGTWVGPPLIALGWLLYSAGDLLLVEVSWHLGAIVVAIGSFASIAGARYLRRLLPAFAVLAFMVPVPGIVRQQIALPLQRTTALAVQHCLELLGASAVASGNAVVVNGKEVLVAEACNGLRMVFALLLVSVTFAYSSPIRNSVRALIVLLSPITAIFCNVLRLVPTIWVHGYVSEAAGEWMHSIGGWVMLPIAFLMLLGCFRLLRWSLIPVYRYTLAYGR